MYVIISFFHRELFSYCYTLKYLIYFNFNAISAVLNVPRDEAGTFRDHFSCHSISNAEYP